MRMMLFIILLLCCIGLALFSIFGGWRSIITFAPLLWSVSITSVIGCIMCGVVCWDKIIDY